MFLFVILFIPFRLCERMYICLGSKMCLCQYVCYNIGNVSWVVFSLLMFLFLIFVHI